MPVSRLIRLVHHLVPKTRLAVLIFQHGCRQLRNYLFRPHSFFVFLRQKLQHIQSADEKPSHGSAPDFRSTTRIRICPFCFFGAIPAMQQQIAFLFQAMMVHQPHLMKRRGNKFRFLLFYSIANRKRSCHIKTVQPHLVIHAGHVKIAALFVFVPIRQKGGQTFQQMLIFLIVRSL